MKKMNLAIVAIAVTTAVIQAVQAGPSGATFRVRDYGALCDGTNDDTAAIQKAINAAQAAGGGIVEFPAGTCLLNSCNPSEHPWFFYNLRIGSNVKLHGTNGTRLLQGPGGRHALAARAPELRNTVLAFGPAYASIRFQNPAVNGGFFDLKATTANTSSATLAAPTDASHFKVGDYVAIYESTKGDVIPMETAQVASMDNSAGVLQLKEPLSRSFPNPVIANVTAVVTTNVGIENMIVQGSEPLAVTETFGFKAQDNQFLIESEVGASNVCGLNLNTLRDFQFVRNTFKPTGTRYVTLELTQRDSRNGLYASNTFDGSNMGFGEYAAHITFINNHFWIHATPSVVAGIFIGGIDVNFTHNDVHGGNVTGGSGWGVILADFIGPAEYASYVGQIKIVNNTFNCQEDGNACIGAFARDTCVISNSITVKGSACGIHAEGVLLQSNRIQANKLLMGSGDGILVAIPPTGGSHTIVTGNLIAGSAAHGIFVNARGATNVGGCTISGNTITGFKTPVFVR